MHQRVDSVVARLAPTRYNKAMDSFRGPVRLQASGRSEREGVAVSVGHREGCLEHCSKQKKGMMRCGTE